MKKKLQSISNIANKRNHIIAISGCLVIIGIILMIVCLFGDGGLFSHANNGFGGFGGGLSGGGGASSRW